MIYDAAHTFGVKYKDRGIGSYGDISCYSFHATKVFHTIEGGAVCFKDEKLKDLIGRLKDFGIYDEESVTEIGPNAKMNEFCAAMGLCNLRHIDEKLQNERRIVQRYRERLEHIEGVQLSPIQKDVVSNYAYFPVVFWEEAFGTGRDEVKTEAWRFKYGARKYFYPLTSSFACYEGQYSENNLLVAKKISDRVLTLPLYADLSLEEVDQICDIIVSCKKN